MTKRIRILGVLCVLCGSALGLDRQAFTFTDYNLQVRIEPAKQALEASGKLTLRNDSSAPQRVAVLQITSTLAWKSVTAAGKPVQYLSQPYTSDIDHTGSLSEAIVTLPREVPPQGSIELEISYGGAIPQDSTRLTRIGAPAQIAARSDWDQISESFTAVRGIGYVAWYPIATESAGLPEGNSLFETIGAWKAREARSTMRLTFQYTGSAILRVNGRNLGGTATGIAGLGRSVGCEFSPLGLTVPAFALADYRVVDQPSTTVFHLPGHQAAAADYARVAEQVQPLVAQWFGPARQKLQIVELPDANAATFETGAMLFTPLAPADVKSLELTLVHQLVHAAFDSSRPWIYEGLAHFFQALQRQQQGGHKAALEYLQRQLQPLAEAEKPRLSPGQPPRSPDSSPGQPLITATDEIFYRTKAMFVWWMLRDMLGDAALQRALRAYRPEQDKEPSYLQRLLQAESHRDLEWFFDDWVYRDRGLPDFRIVSAYPRRLLPEDYSVTVTVENLGDAGAEVPVMVRAERGEAVKRLEVRAREKAVVRVPVPAIPKQAVVNDGSVPESNSSNNTFDIKLPETGR